MVPRLLDGEKMDNEAAFYMNFRQDVG